MSNSPISFHGASVFRFAHGQKGAGVYHSDSIPNGYFDVFYCCGIDQPLNEIMPEVRNWD